MKRGHDTILGKPARRFVLVTTGVAVLSLTLLLDGFAADAPKPARSPNILFILADDLGYGDLKCYGNPYLETPALDALARSGIRFTAHYSPSPLCAPARAGYLTGRFNHRTGAIDVSSNRGIDRIVLTEKTFGDYFRHAGYATALVGKWHNGVYCNDYLPHHRGFDLFYGFANGQHDYWKWQLARNDKTESHDGRYLTDALNDEAITFIRQHRDKPFALWLAHHAPHLPLQAPQPAVDKCMKRLRGVHSESVATIYAMIEVMDAGLARVFEELRQQGLWQDTVIVFTSDNGAELGASSRKGESCDRYTAGFSGNKGMVLEQGIRVPAIVSWPGRIPGGRVVATPIHGCDWLPTLFSLTGASAPAGAKPMDGMDLMPLLLGGEIPALKDRMLPFQKNRYTPVAHSDGAIRHENWKLYWPGEATSMKKDLMRDNYSFQRSVVRPHWEMPLDPGLPSYEGIKTAPPQLFNLAADPGEKTDLALQHPEIVHTLMQAYDRWFAVVFAEWQQANQKIIEHDQAYWRGKKIPDPGALFEGFWAWDRAPKGTDPKTANALKVFTGYWSHKNNLD